MASPSLQPASPSSSLPETSNDNDTDYGSDFTPEEDAILSQLLSAPPSRSTSHIPTILEEEDNPITTDLEFHDAREILSLPRVRGSEYWPPLPVYRAARTAEEVVEQFSQVVAREGERYPDLPVAPKDWIKVDVEAQSQVDAEELADDKPDTRSPLEKFRTKPRKALSVSDLVAPAWCELQYWYTLNSKTGKKTQTVAMKTGSKIHKVLEDQVHKSVKVDIETKEDSWGLRIWNVIQGLKTLRDTGRTREMEVWGAVDGALVNGCIDELSFICPDPQLEATTLPPPSSKNSSKNEPPPDQPTISEFFKATHNTQPETSESPNNPPSTQKLYICDVKTRGVRSIPNTMAFRPTRMQLMLYHRLLTQLCTNTFDFSTITTRFNLDPLKTFSDSFIAQVGSLNDEFYSAPSSQVSVSPPLDGEGEESQGSWLDSQDSTTVLLAHSNLGTLWGLMVQEFRATLPYGKESMGRVLKAEYRSRDDGEIVGVKTLLMDEGELNVYLEGEMKFWKGAREPQGVVIEEAFKCRSCEFAEGCGWRLKKIEEVKEKNRMSRRRSSNV